MRILKIASLECLPLSNAMCNPFLTIFLILYFLKITENQTFSGGFRKYEMKTMARNGLTEMRKFNLILEFQTKYISAVDTLPWAKFRNRIQYQFLALSKIVEEILENILFFQIYQIKKILEAVTILLCTDYYSYKL